MNFADKLMSYIRDPHYRFNVNSHFGLYDRLSDEDYTRRQYKLITGHMLDLDSPKRFNEKLQWLKLYYRKPEFTTMVDKFAVKGYLNPLIGEQHIIRLLGVWDHFNQIDFTQLPDRFVLKTTHGSGGISVCRDKTNFDYAGVKSRFEKALKRNYYYLSREWPYKNVKPRIIAEEYMQDGNIENLNVYKFFCFSGEPYLIQTIQNDKTPCETIDYFDLDWNLLELHQNFPNSRQPLKKPKTLNIMVELSRKCSQGLPFIRVDWYEVNGQVYFSEFTFYTDAGCQPFHPDEWDFKLGDMIILPENKVL